MNKLPVLNLNQDIITSNRVGIRTCSDYSPFGVELDGRTVSGGYRYGYQGSEKDNETKGNGNSYTTEFRQLDPRLGRWLSVDPLSFKFPWQSTYIAFDNNPISLVDRLGSETEGGPGDGYKKNKDGSRSKTNANGTKTYDAPGFSSVNLPANAKVLGTMQDVDGNKDGAIYNNGVKYQASVGDLAKFEVNDVTYTAQFFKGQFIDFENDNGKKYVFNPQSNDVEISVNQSYFDLMANEIIENTSPAADLVLGVSEYKIGEILTQRAKYGSLNPETIIRTPLLNISTSTKLIQGTGTVLKCVGFGFGVAGIVGTVSQYQTGKISGAEASLDLIMGGVGFIPGGGWMVSGTYFLIAKPLYNYTVNP